MPEIEDYLKLAASNFKTAEAELEDAERSLHKCVERLENSLKLVRQIPCDEPLLPEQPLSGVSASQPFETKELQLVSS